MINLRIKNSISNMGISSDVPHVRASNFQTTRTGDGIIAVGTPIGLLLALTYAQNENLTLFGDYRPNMRINSN